MTRRLFMTTDAIGGVWRYATLLATELAAFGMQVRLGIVGDSPTRDRQREICGTARIDWIDLGVPLDWLAGSTQALTDGQHAIAEAASDWGADVIQINQPAFAGTFYSAPVVTVVHSCVESWWRGTYGRGAPPEWSWHREAVRRGLLDASAAVAPTHAFAAAITTLYELPTSLRVVRNGIPSCGIDRPRPREDFVLAAGRAWDDSKNFSVLDQAAQTIYWPVHLAGECRSPDGDGQADFPNLHCLGRLDGRSMAEQFGRAPIFVAPSLYEPFGLAVLEAARNGAALILSDIATFRELWDGAALFFDPSDPNALAAQINSIIADPALRMRQSDAACQRAKAYTIEQTVHGMRHVFGTLPHGTDNPTGLEVRV